MRTLVVIPARMHSSRLPGKPLLPLGDAPLLAQVIRQVQKAKCPELVVVATDTQEILELACAYGARGLMTPATCHSGTDRVAAALTQLEAGGEHFDQVLNIQGDEPFLEPEAIDRLSALLCLEGEDAENGATHSASWPAGVPRKRAQMVTLARPLEASEAEDPNVVKVVCDLQGYALYFSRAPIGADRSQPQAALAYAHLGLYGYSAKALHAFSLLPPSPLEQAEQLEQLRALEHGWPLRVGVGAWSGFGIDTPEDLERARQRQKASQAIALEIVADTD